MPKKKWRSLRSLLENLKARAWMNSQITVSEFPMTIKSFTCTRKYIVMPLKLCRNNKVLIYNWWNQRKWRNLWTHCTMPVGLSWGHKGFYVVWHILVGLVSSMKFEWLWQVGEWIRPFKKALLTFIDEFVTTDWEQQLEVGEWL